jgi:glyoxylase-like metal-dependent hydrolase (beta-lactamase superfamily II)
VVAFTHLHFDHAGWAFTEGANDLHRKIFPNARYVVSGQELIHDHPDAMSERFVPPLAAAARPISDDEEVFPGVRALAVSGHTPGHMACIIDTGTDVRVIVVGDAFHSPAQISHPEWSAVADHDVAQAFAARRTLLTELARPNTFGFAYHFSDQPFGRVTTDGTGAATWAPIPATAARHHHAHRPFRVWPRPAWSGPSARAPGRRHSPASNTAALNWRVEIYELGCWPVVFGSLLGRSVVPHVAGVNGRDGNVFDSSYGRGAPVQFPRNGVVPGFQKAIAGQKVGSTVAVAVTSADGYPEGQPSAGIHQGDTLIFAIKILDASS